MKIEKYRNDLEVIRSTAEQIKKDLGSYGSEINLTGYIASTYTELLDQITPILKGLYYENKSEFMNLMYRIDVDEAQMNQALTSSEEKKTFTILVDMILERELVKCITRKLYQVHDQKNK